MHVSRSSSLIVQLLLLKSSDSADVEWCKEVKGNMYDMVVEGFQLLSRWTARIWEQCAWKFSRPCKVSVPMESYEASVWLVGCASGALFNNGGIYND
ncbi:Protein PIR [Vitis vinifera]|uniref:Protein PIR n=1 Tax=Vitis vinifera TaxID=29760 RepID=A0A438EJ00_VITVI|nr:Protein PIR [Vitis vinifera]